MSVVLPAEINSFGFSKIKDLMSCD